MTVTAVPHEFFGYQMIQNPSNPKLALYCGAINAQHLRHIVSVDNPVKWDDSSGTWRSGGKNRLVEESHWRSIQEFLSSTNLEGILPQALVIAVESSAFNFSPFTGVAAVDRVLPGIITIKGSYEVDPGDPTRQSPVAESDRIAWVLDGQHRIMAFRNWSMPDPYPVNVVIIKSWKGDDYEDAMRHQTYELNMGKPLNEDFKAAVREQYKGQIGHRRYKQEIAVSWIRKDLESRGRALSRDGIVGAPRLRTPYVLSMSFVEKIIWMAFDYDKYLKNQYVLEKMSASEVKEVGKYLFDFFEGVRLSIGVLNPNTKGTIGATPEVAAASDYWDIAVHTDAKQRLLNNVGMKALVRGLLELVMRSASRPQSPDEVAKLLDHMRGIPWHDKNLVAKKDDWVPALASALKTMYESKGTKGSSKKYQLRLEKKDAGSANTIDTTVVDAYGW